MSDSKAENPLLSGCCKVLVRSSCDLVRCWQEAREVSQNWFHIALSRSWSPVVAGHVPPQTSIEGALEWQTGFAAI